jgi:pyridoxine 5-phosphate synthase
MPKLGLNIDHVATVRQARRTVEPDPVWAAVEGELGGADVITFHLRKDRRHVNDRDARLLRDTVRCKLNMEMSMAEEIVAAALELKPDQVTLVPESREEITTEGGLDAATQLDRLRRLAETMHEAGITVSAFVDPVEEQIHAAREAACDAVEIHTGAYANACLARTGRHAGGAEATAALADIRSALDTGLAEGLTVHGGHGLTYNNVAAVAAMAGFTEFNIGHSIISRAVFVGLREAVAEMKRVIDQSAGGG